MLDKVNDINNQRSNHDESVSEDKSINAHSDHNKKKNVKGNNKKNMSPPKISLNTPNTTEKYKVKPKGMKHIYLRL